MIVQRTCIICGQGGLDATPAIVGPFVERHVVERWPEGERPAACLLHCLACDVAFFDLRLEEDEVENLYVGYRGEQYYRRRHRLEPLYTRALNDGIGKDRRVIDMRRSRVEAFVSSLVGSDVVHSVLDVGGDAGQFIPSFRGAAKAVVEMSDVEPIPGVERVATLADQEKPADLVMVAHVLEHVSDPLALLREVGVAVRAGGYLYVEVPQDRPAAPPRWALRAQQRYVDFVSRSFRRTVIADWLSMPLRVVSRGHWTPGVLPRVHEHLNFFSQTALDRALLATGWQPMGHHSYRCRVGALESTAIGVLAQRRPEEDMRQP